MPVVTEKLFPSATTLIVAVIAIGLGGCQRDSSEPQLVPAKTLVRLSEARVKTGKELPERILNQIDGALKTYYGTASEPRLYEPAGAEAEAGGAATTEAAATTEEAAASDGSAAPAEKQIKLKSQTKPEVLKRGLAVFTQRCAACHGALGNGEGPVAAYLRPRPRDYRLGMFKFTSTPFGAKPRREDLIRTVLRGAKGTSMPAFALLEEEDLQAVVDYVIMLSQRGEVEQNLFVEGESLDAEDPQDNFLPEDIAAIVTRVAESWREAKHQQVVPLTAEPAYTEESVEKGRQVFMTNECFKCHGLDGRGRTPEPVGKDGWTGEDVFAADLSSGMLRGGRRSQDIYRRIYSGINGTPMPGFAAKFNDNPEQIWQLVHFIKSVTEGRKFAAGVAEEPKPPDAPTTPPGTPDSTPTETP
jgi:mono/diheme cytochrome c family protein